MTDRDSYVISETEDLRKYAEIKRFQSQSQHSVLFLMKTFRFLGLIIALFALDVSSYGAQMLRNLSFRSTIATGDNAPTAGFVIRALPGTRFGAKKTLLIRAVGPSLGQAPFNIQNAATNPRLELYTGTRLVVSNEGWDSSAQSQLAARNVGAFPLLLNSKDAVIFVDLEEGAHTARVTGAGNGIVLIEVYDVSRDADNIEIVNMSARALVTGNGAQAGTIGLVVDGTGPRQILARVSGPELAAFGITNGLPDPGLTVFNGQGTVVGSNSDWGGSSTMTTTFAQNGAFPWPANSKGAAIIFPTTGLGTVSYTIRGGQDNASGIVVIEMYRL